MIIEDTCNQFYRVWPAPAEIPQCWFGQNVKRVKGEWVPTARGLKRPVALVSKAHSLRVVEA